MARTINIGRVKIGIDYPPFIIAEMSGNHNQSLDRALKLVDSVADSGAHALKIQTYTPDTMTLDLAEQDFYIQDPKSPWYGYKLYDLYTEAMTPYEWHGPIFERCTKRGLMFFSTPFDETAVDFLEQFDPPAYKISSFENSDVNLLKKVADTGKPVLVSTGMATIRELDLIVNSVLNDKKDNLILLKCTSAYPANPAEINLKTITHMSEMFDLPIGLSDHTLGIGVAVSAVALGARVIEKHFTLSRKDGGVDSAFSMEPNEFKSLVQECNKSYQALGDVKYCISKNEENSLSFRRSIYIVRDITKGEVITNEDIRCIRPGYGAEPKLFDYFVGKKVNQDLKAGTAMNLNYLLVK